MKIGKEGKEMLKKYCVCSIEHSETKLEIVMRCSVTLHVYNGKKADIVKPTVDKAVKLEQSAISDSEKALMVENITTHIEKVMSHPDNKFVEFNIYSLILQRPIYCLKKRASVVGGIPQ